MLNAATVGRKYESLYKWSRWHDQDINHTHIWQKTFQSSSPDPMPYHLKREMQP